MSSTIKLTVPAFSAMTQEQRDAIFRLACGAGQPSIDVQKGGLGLPDTYLAIRLDYPDPGNGSIYGGIAPDGAVST